MSVLRSKTAIAAGAAVLFAALTCWYLDFHLSYAGSELPADLEDTVLVVYFLEWGGKSLAQGPGGYLDFWNANFFFPEKRVMTLSDHVLGPAVQASVFKLLWDNTVAGYNFLFLGSFALSGLTTAWVVRQAGSSVPAAVLAGVMFAFSPYRFDQRAHLQVLLMQWIPLVLWFWHRLLEEPVVRRAVPFLAVYLLHVTGGMYLAYFVHFALALLVLVHLDRRQELVAPRSLRVLVPTLALCAAAAAAIFVPYALTADRLGLEREEADYAYFGATLLSWVSPGSANRVWGDLLGRLERPDSQLFAGLVGTLFAAIGIRLLWRRRRASVDRDAEPAVGKPAAIPVLSLPRRVVLAVLLAVTGCGLLLGDVTTLALAEGGAMPEVTGWRFGYGAAAVPLVGGGLAWVLLWRRWRGAWPLVPPNGSRWDRGVLAIGLFFVPLSFPVVFALAARIVPGLDGMRAPTRVYPYISFALASFAARGLDWVLGRWRGWRRPAAFAVVLVLMAIELRNGMRWHYWPTRSEIPAIFHRIAEVPDVGAILHLPLTPHALESHYMYYSIAHWRPIANGFSGYEPPAYVELKRRVKEELGEASTLEYFSELGITHIALHPWQSRGPWERRRFRRWEQQFSQGDDARLRSVLVVGRDRLYEIVPRADREPNR